MSFVSFIIRYARISRLKRSETRESDCYGTTTDKDDEVVVTYPFIMGKYTSHIAKAGYFCDFLTTPQGYIVCICVPFMLLIVYQGMNFFTLFRRYKKEHNEQIEEEKRQLEAELNVGKDEEKI